MATKTATVVQPEAADTRDEGPDAPLLDTLGAELKKLVQKGRERGYITYDELNAALPPDEGCAEQIRSLTRERGADIAIEVSGAGSALQAAIDAVAVEGTVVVASWYGTKPVTLALGGHFHRGRVRLRSSQVGKIGPEQSARWDHARRTETVADLLPRRRSRIVGAEQP